MIPSPKIVSRKKNLKREKLALEQGIHPVLANVIARRPFLEQYSPLDLLSPKLAMLDNPSQLADMERAVARTVQAIINQEVIGLETDHDCDGQTSHAILHDCFTNMFNHPKEKLQSFIGHRLKEGYGLSEALKDRILATKPLVSLVITADNGSSDEPRIADLKAKGIDVIVTDHHQIPAQGIPKSAHSVLNPTRDDCLYPDPMIAGCMVAWLFMACVRSELVKQGHIPQTALKMRDCLDYVALGTVADCVSVARSINNRAVINAGLKRINQFSRPCWQVLRQNLNNQANSKDLGFAIGPLLNSDGRLDDALGSVSFLLSKDTSIANSWVEHLSEHNQKRKAIQKEITNAALQKGLELYQRGNHSIVVYLENGHSGVHGISASRIKDMFGRPTVIFSPKKTDSTLISGSGRSIDGFDLAQALQRLNTIEPNLMVAFGGHHGAAGVTIRKDDFLKFQRSFEQVAKEALETVALEPFVFSDGEIPLEYLSVQFVEDELSQLEPFGREFEQPVYECQANIVSIKWMGQPKIHVRLEVAIEGVCFTAIWFNAKQGEEDAFDFHLGQEVKLAYTPTINEFRAKKSLNLLISHLQAI